MENAIHKIDNRAKFHKKIMRLCAFAMIEGNGVHEKEKDEIITSIIIDDFELLHKETDNKEMNFSDDEKSKLLSISELCMSCRYANISKFFQEIYKYEEEKDIKHKSKKKSKSVEDNEKEETEKEKEFRKVINDILGKIIKKVSSGEDKLSSEDIEEYWKILDPVKLPIFSDDKFLAHLRKNQAPEESLEKLIFQTLKTEYVDKLLRCFFHAKSFIDNLIEKLDESDNRKSLFMNIDSLSKEEICCELKNMVIVAKADNSLTDRERELFYVICKLYRIENSKELWQDLTGKTIDALRHLTAHEVIKSERNDKLYLVDVDFRDIESAVKFYDIKGPVIDGIKHLLSKNMMSYKDSIMNMDRNINQKAILLFIISAVLLFLSIIDIHEHSIIVSWKNYLIENLNLKKCTICTTNNTMRNITYGQIGLSILSGLTFICSWCSYRKQKKVIFIGQIKSAYTYWAAFASICCLVVAFRHISLLVMMLSIEWLIFMKEQLLRNYLYIDNNTRKSSEKSSNSSILIVIVAAAIIADICLGLIEIYQNNDGEIDIKEFLVKTASAVFLGCICFFCGKFLDNFRMEQIRSLDTMNEVINEIGRKDRENNPNNFYSKVAFLKEQFNNRNYNP